MNNRRNTRGAMRHWVIGCGIVFLIIVVAIGGLGYFGFKEIKKHVDIGFIDTAKKPDPPLNAAPEDLFPATVGAFERVELTTVDQITPPDELNTTTHSVEMDESGAIVKEQITSKSVSIEADATSGIVHARYTDPAANVIYAYALNPAQATEVENSSPNRDLIRRGRGGNKTGFHMSLKSGNQPFSMATWSKPNWTYYVQTTSTLAMDFVENFNPVVPSK